MRWLAFVLLAVPAAAQEVPVPSGQAVRLLEVVTDAEGGAWRFRFVAPAVAREGGTVSIDTALSDMLAVCDRFVAPELARRGVAPNQVIISFADRPTPFVAPSPEATQLFEAFSLDGAACIWEGF